MIFPLDSKLSFERNVPLSKYCTMQVGGPALFFAEPSREEDLIEALAFARREKLPYRILGKGSNILFADEGYGGLVISLLRFETQRLEIDRGRSLLTASAGVHLSRLVMKAKEEGLSGAEFLCNVPGTVGGAVRMNAGFSRFAGKRNEIGDWVEEVTVLDGMGKKEILRRRDLRFGYRQSNLGERIVLAAALKLRPEAPEVIEREIRANFEYRNAKQDLRYPSSGSVFKNPRPPSPSAGILIEKAGLKGRRVGDAMVSQKHGNYIVNTGRARSADILELIALIQETVFNATGVSLEPEIHIVKSS